MFVCVPSICARRSQKDLTEKTRRTKQQLCGHARARVKCSSHSHCQITLASLCASINRLLIAHTLTHVAIVRQWPRKWKAKAAFSIRHRGLMLFKIILTEFTRSKKIDTLTLEVRRARALSFRCARVKSTQIAKLAVCRLGRSVAICGNPTHTQKPTGSALESNLFMCLLKRKTVVVVFVVFVVSPSALAFASRVRLR